MKTERVTLLTSPEFKAFLGAEAQREGVSVGELVRRRCEGRPSADETALAALTTELRAAVRDAKKSLGGALDEAHAILGTLQAGRSTRVTTHLSTGHTTHITTRLIAAEHEGKRAPVQRVRRCPICARPSSR